MKMMRKLSKLSKEYKTCRRELEKEEEKQADLEVKYRLAQIDANDAATKISTSKAAAERAEKTLREKTKAKNKAKADNPKHKNALSATKELATETAADKAQKDYTEMEGRAKDAVDEVETTDEALRTTKKVRDDQDDVVERAKETLRGVEVSFSKVSSGEGTRVRAVPIDEKIKPMGDATSSSAMTWRSVVERIANRNAVRKAAADSASATKQSKEPEWDSSATLNDRAGSTDREARSRSKGSKEQKQKLGADPARRAESTSRSRSDTKAERSRRSGSSSGHFSDSGMVGASSPVRPPSSANGEMDGIKRAVKNTSMSSSEAKEWVRQHKANQSLVERSGIWAGIRMQHWHIVESLGGADLKGLPDDEFDEDKKKANVMLEHQKTRIQHSVNTWKQHLRIERRYARILEALGEYPSPQASKQWLAPIIARQLNSLAKVIKADGECFAGRLGHDRKRVKVNEKVLKVAQRDLEEIEAVKYYEGKMDVRDRAKKEHDRVEKSLNELKRERDRSEVALQAAKDAHKACVARRSKFEKAFGVSVESFVPEEEV